MPISKPAILRHMILEPWNGLPNLSGQNTQEGAAAPSFILYRHEDTGPP